MPIKLLKLMVIRPQPPAAIVIRKRLEIEKITLLEIRKIFLLVLGLILACRLLLIFAIAVQININLTFSFAFNYAFTLSYNLGISSSVFLSGRTTNITGTDLKFVVGLDAKKVDLALDLKGVDLSTKFTQAQKDEVKAWQAGIEAGNGNLSAEATAALKVFL